MSFRRPDVERVLGQIPRVGFHSREAHREPEQRFIVITHERFKLFGWIHNSLTSVMPQKLRLLFLPLEEERHNGT